VNLNSQKRNYGFGGLPFAVARATEVRFFPLHFSQFKLMLILPTYPKGVDVTQPAPASSPALLLAAAEPAPIRLPDLSPELLELYSHAMDRATGIVQSSLAASNQSQSYMRELMERIACEVADIVVRTFAFYVEAQMNWLRLALPFYWWGTWTGLNSAKLDSAGLDSKVTPRSMDIALGLPASAGPVAIAPVALTPVALTEVPAALAPEPAAAWAGDAGNHDQEFQSALVPQDNALESSAEIEKQESVAA
jgi:hypothetical protein